MASNNREAASSFDARFVVDVVQLRGLLVGMRACGSRVRGRMLLRCWLIAHAGPGAAPELRRCCAREKRDDLRVECLVRFRTVRVSIQISARVYYENRKSTTPTTSALPGKRDKSKVVDLSHPHMF
eukprot:3525114-Prymnesium_polylepis.1